MKLLPKFRSAAWLALLCVGLLTACSDSPDQVVLTEHSVVLAFGDSLTQGVGAAEAHSYPSVLQQSLGIPVLNRGISGETSAQGLARLEQVLQDTMPDLVILCYGGNDILRKLPLDQLEANLEQMISLVQAYQAEIILVGVPRPSLTLSTLPVYEELAERHSLVAELDILGELLRKPSMKSDSVHLNQAGYQALAESLSARIRVL